MSSIGPQLPAYLLKQRSPVDGSAAGDDEDDEIGPQPDAQVPPHIVPTAAAVVADDDEDEDAYGPALPPDLLVSRAGPSKSPPPPPQTRRTLGPSMPGHDRQTYTRHDEGGDGDDVDSDDDGYGPMPLPASAQRADGVSEGVREFVEKEERRRKEVEEAAKPKKPKRDEWMLVPPSSSDLLGRLSDPMKLKARQFSRGAGAASRSAPNNLWTETPAERQQRVADEVAGKRRRAANADPDAGEGEGVVGKGGKDERKRRRRDEEMRRVVDEHNKSTRGKTLLELHSSADGSAGAESGKKGGDDSEGGQQQPPGIWDHARDMATGGRLMDEKQRSKLIADARSLGDRFGSGKGGGYL